MYAPLRTPVVVWVITLWAWAGPTPFAVHSHAQAPLPGINSPARTPLPEPTIEVDISALLTNKQVFEDSIRDNIWNIQPLPGRRLIQLPLIVTPAQGASRLGSPPIKLRGGRFIAWRIVPDDERTKQGLTGTRSAQQPRADNPYSIRRLRGVDYENLGQLDRPRRTTDPARAQEAAQPQDELPAGAPLLARSLTISQNAVIRWNLSRAIPGGEVKSGDEGYLLKLRPERLQKLRPTRPERQTRSGSQNSREAAAKRRASELEYRQKAQEYRELRDQVRNLPETFQAKLPARLWAIFEVSDRMDKLSLTGPAPLPWVLPLEDLESLKQTANSRRSGRNDTLGPEDYAAISQMTLLLADEHPMTQRIVAETVVSANLFAQAQTGDALYRLVQALLKGEDAQAKRRVTAGLASTVPPTSATLALLKGAFANLDSVSKLLALGGMLATQNNDPIGQRQMLETANQMISDPQGPGAAYVLDQLARTLADKPDAVALVGGGIRFDALSPEALDHAIVYTADAAGDSPVAAEWMEHGLLGSSNPAIVRRTVEILGTSAPGGGTVSMLTKMMVQFGFGPAVQNAASRSKPPLRGIARIPITSTGHSIYRVLNAGDPELRAMGWKALRHFQVLDNRNTRRTQPINGQDPGPDRLTLILDAAFNETVTPPQLVTFLVNQRENTDATAALVRIVVEGRGPAITQSARALVRSGRPLEQPIRDLQPDQRGTFAARLYEAVTGSSPMVAGLMRVTDTRSPLVYWFAQQVSTSGLPELAAWAPAANGEDNLLTLAASSDPELADAAIASLVALAGGDERTARDLARRLSNATDRSVKALRQQWTLAKQDIYTARLSHAAGRYRLIVNLRGNADPTLNPSPRFGGFGSQTPAGDVNPADALPLIKRFNVALIQLEADGHSLSLGSGTLTLGASDSQLAIALLDPNELKAFGHEQLNDLPLQQINQPIDLLPQKDGSWRGAAPMPDGRYIQVIFKPES